MMAYADLLPLTTTYPALHPTSVVLGRWQTGWRNCRHSLHRPNRRHTDVYA